MLATRLTGLLPPLTDQEALEAAAITGLLHSNALPTQWRCRAFRAPHHSASMAALIGGGSIPRPGEISLAHNGVLFLDELPEFDAGYWIHCANRWNLAKLLSPARQPKSVFQPKCNLSRR